MGWRRMFSSAMAANWRSISGVMSSSTLYCVHQRVDECALGLGGVGAVRNVADVDGFAGDVEAEIFRVGVVDEPGFVPTVKRHPLEIRPGR